MNDCGTPLTNRQLESYAQDDATILQIRNGSARDQASATFSSEVLSLLNNDSAQAVQNRAQEIAACKTSAADSGAQPAGVDPAEQRAAAEVAKQLSNPAIQLDKVSDTVTRAFKPLSEDWMRRFADDINQMLQGTGVSLDVHNFRGSRRNLAVTVSGLSGGRATEVFIGPPKSN